MRYRSHFLPRLDPPDTWIGAFAFLAETRMYSNADFFLNLM
jgi:hypothetical protein